MAFEKIIKTAPGAATRNPDYVGMSCRKGSAKQLVASISLASGSLGWLAWTPGTKVGAERGTGNDAGILRLTKDDLRGFSIHKNGGASHSGLILIRELAAAEPHKAAPVEYEIKDGAIYITLPEWARQSSE